MKDQIRVCGIDDAPFAFGDRSAKAVVIGTVVRAPSYLEGVLRFEISVDGEDSTGNIEEAIASSRFREQLRAIIIDGIALGGFNIVDIQRLSESLGMPVITVTRDVPDMRAIEAALSKYFDDWKERISRISSVPVIKIEAEKKPIFVSYAGTEPDQVREILRVTTVRGSIPEPIRMAHIIASGVVRGESRGKV